MALRLFTWAAAASLSCFSYAAPAQSRDSQCRQPIAKDFPSAAPASVGASAHVIARLSDALDAGKFDIRSLLILRHCTLIFERYKDGVDREHNHAVYSVTKSISATLVGALMHQGKLQNLDAPLAELIPKPLRFPPQDWDKATRITLRHAMTMASGLAYKHDSSNHLIYGEADRLEVALKPDFAAEPGTRFNYSDADATLTGAVIAARAGKDLYRTAKEILFEPLQMANHDWWFVDRAGRYPGGWGLRLRPMDMAKLGQLYLQQGEWNGRRIFAAEFPAQVWQPGPSPSYGLHWWIATNARAKVNPLYYALGKKGQFIYLIPNFGIMAVMTSSLPDKEIAPAGDAVVIALRAMVEPQGAALDQAAAARLDAIQRAGFKGETRVYQAEQDKPRR
jgi:CubicO group peptidase (beta-lactamase class C family)